MDEIYELAAGGLSIKVIPLGATITSLLVPDRDGVLSDVVLGYGTADEYEASRGPYFGAVIGRVAGRIPSAVFELDGSIYRLAENTRGASLHGGAVGFDKRLFSAQYGDYHGAEALYLTYISPDGEEGYPGEMTLHVMYSLLEDGIVAIGFQAVSDAATFVNITNHVYFNLGGHDAGSVSGHELWINSESVTETDENLCATGRFLNIAGTELDYRVRHPINVPIDHCYILPENVDRWQTSPVATVYHKESGRCMDVYTNCGAMQVYTGNFLNGERGKNRAIYNTHSGFCLETQDYPPVILKPGETYSRTTFYQIYCK